MASASGEPQHKCCSVCCSAFTTKVRTAIQCPFCNFEACASCVKKFLLDSIFDARCMSCSVGWTPDFLDANLSKGFRTGKYAEHRRQVLLQREKSLLPQTMEDAEREKNVRLLEARLRDLANIKRELKNQLDDTHNNMHAVRNDMWILRAGHQLDGGDGQRRAFVKACPADGCRGFLSTLWKCGLCQANVCKECYEVKEAEEHTCRPEAVETAKLLAAETKSCPSCGIPISKVDGCSQMWCVHCATAFDWNTMRIERGVVHNPEYFRYMRERGMSAPRLDADELAQGVARGDGCIRRMTFAVLINVTKKMREMGIDPKYGVFDRVFRLSEHMEHYELPKFDEDPRRRENRDLRVAFLLNDINEREWQVKLLKREKEAVRKSAFRQLVQMFVDVSSDLFRRYSQSKTQAEVDSMLVEFYALKNFYNESAYALTERFGYRFHRIDDTWNVSST